MVAKTARREPRAGPVPNVEREQHIPRRLTKHVSREDMMAPSPPREQLDRLLPQILTFERRVHEQFPRAWRGDRLASPQFVACQPLDLTENLENVPGLGDQRVGERDDADD